MRVAGILLLAALGCARVRPAALPGTDPGIAAEVAAIRAVDHHAHPQRVLGPGETDVEWDALTLAGPLPDFTAPLGLRADRPVVVRAWHALWDYPYDDATPEHRRARDDAQARVRRTQGDGYAAWVLDRAGIGTMFANRVAMGRGLGPPRFRWVAFVDALLLPLDAGRAFPDNPEVRAYVAAERAALARYLADAGVVAMPATLDGYVDRVLGPTLQRLHDAGALAVKLEAAYFRPLDFGPPDDRAAAAVWAKRRLGAPSAGEYRVLQDALFHRMAREAGRLGLPVHLHTGAGAGGYFDLAGSDPSRLEHALDDPALRGTRFVLVHGGWPFERSTAYLMSKGNVWTDCSAQTFFLPPRLLADTLRVWLSMYPERVMFGTDAFDVEPGLGWEELAWITTTNARQALSLALSDMVRDGDVTRARASELARMVLRDNALGLYGIDAG